MAKIAERRRRLLDAGGLFVTDQRRQVPAEDVVDGATEQVGDVGADLTDLEVGLAHHREHTARLDAARDMDRLAGAVVEVDGRADRHKLVVDRLTFRRRCVTRHANCLTAKSTPSSSSNA